MTSAEYIRKHPLRKFQKGEIILRGGESSDTLLAVRSGFVKIISYSPAGDVRFLWIAGKYDVIPSEHLFLLTKPINFFYIALTDISTYEIQKVDFLKNAKTNLSLMTDTAIAMSTHYDDLLMRLSAMEQPSVRKRLLATLCHIAERFSASETVDFYSLGLTLTHQDLADMINSTRETTNLELQKLRNEGCVSYARNEFIVFSLLCHQALQKE